MTETVKAPFLQRPCDCNRVINVGSTPTLVSLIVASLDKALYDNYLCLMSSNKQQINWEEVKEATGKLGNGQLLSGCGFVQNIAPPSLSRFLVTGE